MAESPALLSSSKRNKKILVIVSVVLAIIIVSGVLISTLPQLHHAVAENSPQKTVSEPKVEITSTNLRAAPVEEHLAYVDVGLYNSGADGTVIVSASISDGTNTYSGNQSISIKAEESMNLTFTFSGISFSNFSDVHAYSWISTAQNGSKLVL